MKKNSFETEMPWFRSFRSQYRFSDKAKKDMNITTEEETLIKDICVGQLTIGDNEEQKAHEVLKSLIEIAYKGGFAGRSYLDDVWLWDCGSWLSWNVQETATRCIQISKTDFNDLLLAIGQNRNEREWSNLVNSYRLLPVPNYRVYSKEDFENVLDKIPSNAPPIWKDLTTRYFRSWISDWEARTVDQRPIIVDVTLPLEARFSMYLDKLNHPSHFTAYRKYFGKKLKDTEVHEFRRLLNDVSIEKHNNIIDILKHSASPFWKRLAKNISDI